MQVHICKIYCFYNLLCYQNLYLILDNFETEKIISKEIHQFGRITKLRELVKHKHLFCSP